MRNLVLENKVLEASEINLSEIIHEYIDRLYFELIESPGQTFKILQLVFENAVQNGLKSHKKTRLQLLNLNLTFRRANLCITVDFPVSSNPFRKCP